MKKIKASRGFDAIEFEKYIFRRIYKKNLFRCTYKKCNAFIRIYNEECKITNNHNHGSRSIIQAPAKQKIIDWQNIFKTS
jgi:hypothetical protein